MDKKERAKYFEDWLSAYANHLHTVRQGKVDDLVRPDASKPPHPADKHQGATDHHSKPKSTGA